MGSGLCCAAGRGGGEVGQSHFRWGENWDSPLKIRSRALITTLWARLVLGDLFLHGIGGAKYDQLTDLLIERFFGLTPPGFMVLSATLHLPIEGRGAGFQSAPNDGRLGKSSYEHEGRLEKSSYEDEGRLEKPSRPTRPAIAQRLRDLTYHPERFAPRARRGEPGRQPGDVDGVVRIASPG